MKKEPVYVLLENASPDYADVDSVRRRPKRKLRVSLRKPKLPETVILAILIWGIAVLSAYDKVHFCSRAQSRSLALEIFSFRICLDLVAPRKNAKSGINSTTWSVWYGPYHMDFKMKFKQLSWSLCEAFYIPPDQESNSLYPYSNTFNVTGPIDWSKSGGSNSLDRYRAIGTHNSYHVQQYEEPGIHIPSGVRTAKKIRTVRQSRV